MSANLPTAITEHNHAELEIMCKAPETKPDSDILSDYARDLDVAFTDWSATGTGKASEDAVSRRRRHAWTRHHGSSGDTAEIGRKCHDLCANEQAALDAIGPKRQ